MKAEILIADLIERTKDNLNRAEKLKPLSDKKLNYKADAETWSILECLEHLNLYGDFYLPEISSRIASSKYGKSADFKTGLIGDYFAKMLLPRERLNKMKTFKVMNPNGSALSRKVIDKFIRQQQQLLELLDKARGVDLNKTKTSISIAKWIKLKLGDTFRVVIYHNQRHIRQAEKIVSGAYG